MLALHRLHLSAMGFMALAIVLSLAALPSTAAAQEQPKRGGTLVVGIVDDPATMNPAISSALASGGIPSQIFNVLVRVDRDLKVIPELAEKWDVSQDGLTYTFHLRRNAKWHDGKPLTSEDVKFSLMDLNRKYQGAASTALAMVESVGTPDPYTVVFKLQYPYTAFFPWSVGGMPAQAMILPKHLYEGTDPTKNEYNFKPMGTGPFIFKEWVRGSHVTLERNPDYFMAGQPYLDRIVFKIIPDAAARVLALEKGEVDYLPFTSLPATAVRELSKVQDVEVLIDRTRASYGQITAFFNLRHPQLQVREVRRAIAYAVDRKAIVDKALDGLADPGISPVSSHHKKLHNPDVPRYDFDVAKANQLLDQAGLSRKADGTRFSLRLSFQRGGEGGALDSAAQIMREQLRAVGIGLELQPMDAAAWTDTAFVKWDFDMTMGSFQTGPDPSIGTARLYLTRNIQRLSARNLMGYSNPKVDELFDLGERELDEAKRAAIYKEVQVLLVEDLPALWLWEKPSPIAEKKFVKGLPPGASHYEAFDGVWLTTAAGGQGQASTALIGGVVVVLIAAGGFLVIRRLRST